MESVFRINLKILRRNSTAKIQSQEKHKDELYKSINNEFYTKLLSKEQHWEGKLDKLRHYYETKLESERERTAACILTTKHSTMKGQAGEEFTQPRKLRTRTNFLAKETLL